MVDAVTMETAGKYEHERNETYLLDKKGNCLTYKMKNIKEFRKSDTKKVLLLKG